jgi:uncharacterized protein YfkK (UPF0435 family)
MSDWSSFEKEKAYTDKWRQFIKEEQQVDEGVLGSVGSFFKNLIAPKDLASLDKFNNVLDEVIESFGGNLLDSLLQKIKRGDQNLSEEEEPETPDTEEGEEEPESSSTGEGYKLSSLVALYLNTLSAVRKASIPTIERQVKQLYKLLNKNNPEGKKSIAGMLLFLNREEKKLQSSSEDEPSSTGTPSSTASSSSSSRTTSGLRPGRLRINIDRLRDMILQKISKHLDLDTFGLEQERYLAYLYDKVYDKENLEESEITALTSFLLAMQKKDNPSRAADYKYNSFLQQVKRLNTGT